MKRDGESLLEEHIKIKMEMLSEILRYRVAEEEMEI